jgi:hypothetical protein
VGVSRIACAAAVLALTALAVPAVASAHLRTGTVASGYRATVTSPASSPGAPFDVGVYQGDRALHLRVNGAHTVVVVGYLGERFLRVGAAGVAIDRASPTAAAAGLVTGTTPRTGWVLEPGRRTVVWHDPRVQLGAGLERARWSVPILLDGRRERIVGEIVRLPRPTVWPWLLGVVVLFGVALLLGVRGHARRWERASVVLGAVSATAGLVVVAGFAAGAYASPGTWIAGFNELFCAAVGFGILAAGPSEWRLPTGIGLGLLGLAIGLFYGQIFIDAAALSALPSTATRAFATLAIGAGLAGPLVGGLAYAASTAARSEAT